MRILSNTRGQLLALHHDGLRVCTPKAKHRLLNLALRARSPWLEPVVDKKPCREFNIQARDESLAIFYAATKSELGNGAITLFYAARSVDPVSLCRQLRSRAVNPGDADVACLC
jgi:hypothetical protein